MALTTDQIFDAITKRGEKIIGYGAESYSDLDVVRQHTPDKLWGRNTTNGKVGEWVELP